MLNMTQMIGFADNPKRNPSQVLTANGGDNTLLSSYTINNVSLGPSHPERVIVLFMNCDGELRRITSVKLDGVEMTEQATTGYVNNLWYPAGVYTMRKPTGATGTITVTASTADTGMQYACWAFYDIEETPRIVGRKLTKTAFPELSLNPYEIALFMDYPAAATTWTNATEVLDDGQLTAAVYQQGVSSGTVSASNSYSDRESSSYVVFGPRFTRAAVPKIQYVGGRLHWRGGSLNTYAMSPYEDLRGGISSSAQEGDLLIAIYGHGSTVNRTLSILDSSAVELTLLGTELNWADTFDTNLRVAYKFLTAGDGNITFGSPQSADDGAVNGFVVFRGVDTGTPLDVAVQTATGQNIYWDCPAITPVTAGAMIVAVAACVTSATAIDPPGDLHDHQAVGLSPETNPVLTGFGHYPNWTSGAYNPVAWGSTVNANQGYCAMTIALRPAS